MQSFSSLRTPGKARFIVAVAWLLLCQGGILYLYEQASFSDTVVARAAFEGQSPSSNNATSVSYSAAVPDRQHASKKKKKVTAWCVLHDDNVHHFKHFPHASQALISCWSWFQRQIELNIDNATELSCGFYANATVRQLGPTLSNPVIWTGMMVKQMGCAISNGNKGRLHKEDLIYVPVMADPWGGQWFERPEDVISLRHQVLGPDSGNSDQKGLRVGFVNRNNTAYRWIRNLDQIQKGFEAVLPPETTYYETGMMDNMLPMEQWRFWNDKDIIVAAHGAAVTNGMFLHPHASIIEIYPPHYYPRLFPNLFESMGSMVLHYGYYNGVSDPVSDFNETYGMRTHWRRAILAPPVGEIVNLLKLALAARNDSRLGT
jgi:hypothetical protein